MPNKNGRGDFRDAALPHLDDVYTLARYLYAQRRRTPEDTVQECYLRALRHFDSYRGPAMKPWLLAILKNVCYAEFARRGRHETPTDFSDNGPAAEEPVWQEPQSTPESTLLRQQDDAAIRRLVDGLPGPFREAIVLREINDLSYQEIAEIAGVPVGTVMSRLARARAMLRAAWNAAEGNVQGTLQEAAQVAATSGTASGTAHGAVHGTVHGTWRGTLP